MNRLRWTLFLSFLVMIAACNDAKVPLQSHPGQFDFVSSHWFESEHVQYVFFSIQGLRPGQAALDWPAQFELNTHGKSINGLKAGADGFAALNFSATVHQHTLKACGTGRVCGSYSFTADQPVSSLTLRYRYNIGHPLTETTEIPVAAHSDDGTGDAHSALIYGVFNSDNSAMQVRVHDNFGSPDHDQITQFGMTRSFEVDTPELANFTKDQEAQLATASHNGLLYPATPCADVVQKSKTPKKSIRFSVRENWLSDKVVGDETVPDTCFKVRSLDKNAHVLTERFALGRRNPVLSSDPLQIRPPTGAAVQIPILLSYCADADQGQNLVSPLFLNYQRYVLHIPYATPDACFSIEAGQDQIFARDLDRVLDSKLQAARATLTKPQDLFFTVVIHSRMAKQITVPHQMIADHLAAKINSEVGRQTPRLVGAFVYDSQSAESRKLKIDSRITWCPRQQTKGAPEGNAQNEVTANCTPQTAGKAAFGPVNINIPLGPFPTLDYYETYVAQNNDLGEHNDPKLVITSVHTSINSVSDQNTGQLYTFFDGERLSLRAGENLKLCRERDSENLFDDLVFATSPNAGPTQILNATQASTVLANPQGTALSVHVGLVWDQPYLGEFGYAAPVQGDLLGIIKFSKTFNAHRSLGDVRWKRPVWDLKPLTQKCERFCHHPYFDESGTYQVNTSWQDVPSCPSPNIAEPGGAG